MTRWRRAVPHEGSPVPIPARPEEDLAPSLLAEPHALTPADIARLQRAAGNQAVARMLGRASGRALQREPTEEEKEQLRKRVGSAAFSNYTFVTTPKGVELAIGVSRAFRLIRRKDKRFHWRIMKLKRVGGRGFYGRLGNRPPTLAEIGLQQSMFAAIREGRSSRFTRVRFTAGSSSGARKNNNQVMGKYFLGKGSLSASQYALTPHCEWLHMHGHGLGGRETADNLYAGTHAANSHMAAIEGAVQKLQSLYGDRITIKVTLQTDEHWHSPEILDRIAAEAGVPRSRVEGMRNKASRKLLYVRYEVLLDGEVVSRHEVDALEQGAFDEAQFNLIAQRVQEAITKKGQYEIPFVSGGTLPGTIDATQATSATADAGAIDTVADAIDDDKMDADD